MPAAWPWLVLAAISIASVRSQASSGNSTCDAAGPRANCGYNGIDDATCNRYGCCFAPANATEGGTTLQLPACFYANGGSSNYALQGGLADGDGGAQVGTLTLLGQGTMPMLGADITPLDVAIQNLDQNILRITIGAAGRWEVPASQLFSNTAPGRNQGNPHFSLAYSASPFGFAVSRAGSSAAPLFNTAGNRLIFKDQYLEISSAIPSSAQLFGLGEHTSELGFPLRRDGIPYVLWARDQPPTQANANLYGCHPFILDVRPGGEAYGLLLLSSNGIEVAITQTRLQLRAIGGVLDLYFFTGPTPLEVISQLTAIVGRPLLPPYWSLGLMQSKDGYDSVQYCEQVVANYKAAQIPLETFVSDIQYMNASQDFTLSSSYDLPDLQAFVWQLHAAGQRWVPILDPGIHVQEGYAPYEQGLAQDVFIKDITGKPYTGQLWPGAIYWPDYLAPAAVAWYTQQLTAFYKELPLDGVWLDMDEPSNFCTGDVCVASGPVGESDSFGCSLSCQDGASAAGGSTSDLPPAGIFTPPYSINDGNVQLPIDTKTIAVSARGLDGSLQYDTHNLYGLAWTLANFQALRAIRSKRPFILTRSTFMGSGAYAAHWTGDTNSAWADLQWSIGDMLANGLSGIAFVGADICGFQEYASEELCARWAAAGAWQPFARNHHSDGFQEFYIWPSVQTVAQKVFTWRLRLLPYHYSAFFDAHTFGCPVMRPTFLSFPGDASTLPLAEQWMLGDALLVAPVLQQGMNSRVAYFPQGRWYSLYDYTLVDATSGGKNQTVQAGTTDNTPVYVLGGNIVPIGVNGTNTTSGAQSGNLTLLIALPDGQSPGFQRCGQLCAATSSEGNLVACGHMYLDGGEELDVGSAQDNYLGFEARQVSSSGGSQQGSLVLFWPGSPGAGTGSGCSGNITWPLLDNITVLGAGPVNTASIALTDIGPQSSADGALSAAGAVQAQSASPAAPGTAAHMPLAFASAAYDSGSDALTITGIGFVLACPQGLKFTWVSPTAAPARSSTPVATPAVMPSVVAAPLNAPSLLTAAG